MEKLGWEFFPRYVRAWKRDDEIRSIMESEVGGQDWRDHVTPVQRATYAIAAVSAAFELDLRCRYREWGFPVDDQLFTRLYERWSAGFAAPGL